MSLQKASGDNFGGLAKVMIALRSAVAGVIETLPESVTVSLAQATIDAYFEQVEFNQQSANYDEVPGLGGHGRSWTHSVEIRLLKDRLELRNFFKTYENQQVVALLTDNNGLQLLVGNETEGLYVNDERHKGLKVSDLNQCNCQIAGSTSFESRIVTVI